MLGESRQASYLPPTAPQNPGRAANAASTALRLLECNPDSLLAPDTGSRRGGRLSAAKLARQRYEEALKANAVQGDLLDFDTPSTTPKGIDETVAIHMQSEASTAAPRLADGYRGSSPERNLWPGDIVLARYGPHNAFYRARVVRVYSSRGLSLADVEWLRQGEDAGLGGDFLGSLDDVGLHHHGLQVGTDVRSIQAESQASSRPPVEGETSPKVVLPDLLDFSPEERPRNLQPPQTSGGGITVESFWQPQMVQQPLIPSIESAGVFGINASSRSPDGTKSLAKMEVTPVKPEERFGFVSDLILQASDGHENAR